ncbi:hypothetical protein CKK33_14905 [Mucilaginibacter sp. MD40]|uniref:sensor histidine kinase n=1 Tax=Mucilaginibacter sp. MD40 TaxID=2029590 RepID=UPI000BACABFB|nr:HAMP domain-containing sensor histidine kinase [Mucilaginibacter sp. MD40]PAW94714.1 hypothetical protein CKK33_14905 [Mucilaginibacter sp. MD40]
MKRSPLIITLLISVSLFLNGNGALAQRKDITFLRSQLASAKDSLKYIDTYNNLGFQLHLNSADSTLSYGIKGLQIATRLHYKKGMAFAYSNLGAGLLLKGLYSQALSNYAKSYQLFASMPDTANMMESLMNQAIVYDFLGDSIKRTAFTRKSLKLSQRVATDSVTSMTYINYAALNPGLSDDSVNYYLQKATAVARRFKDERALLAIQQQKADRLLSQNKLKEARRFIDSVQQTAVSKGWDYHYLEALGLRSRYYKALKLTDSALNVNRRIYEVASRNEYSFWKKEVLGDLINAYEVKHNNDSSLYYHKLLVKELEKENAGYDRFIGDYLNYTSAQSGLRLLEAKNAIKSRWIASLVGLAVIMCVLLVITVIQYRKAKITGLQLADNDRFKNRLISVLAHDFRSPLSATLGMIELLRDDSLDKEEAAELFAGLENDLRHVLLTFDNLLVWIKEHSDGYHFSSDDIPLLKAWKETGSFFTSMLSASRLSIEYDIDPMLHLNTDKEILQFVNRNLLHNAVKYSPAGAIIYIKARVDHINVTVSVIDKGPGMSPAQLSQIFFFRKTATNGSVGGAGMAMTIARELLEKLKGTINVSSEPGKGTTFYYTLPLNNK